MIAAVIVCMKNGRKEKGWDEAAHEQEAEAKKLAYRSNCVVFYPYYVSMGQIAW